MLRILVDTCVWLVKDYRQKALLTALKHLIEEGEVSIVLPRIVKDEFERNKARIVKESQQSLSSHFKRVKDAVQQFGLERDKNTTLNLLNEVDHRIGTLGEAVNDMFSQVEGLFADCTVIETVDAVKLRAADRAIEGRAPFHRKKNSIDDAILIETYAGVLKSERAADRRFAFVTHNYNDFSAVTGDSRLPHPDLAACFDQDDTTYSLKLSEVLMNHAPDWFLDYPAVDLEAFEEPRRLSEILEAIDELTEKIWYNRHLGLRNDIDAGSIKVVENYKHKPGRRYPRNIVVRGVWEGALKEAKKVEAKYPDDLGPWSDFDWGIINGKLSALRWVLGAEWDMLDT
jgi:hypothetical protein